MSDFDVTKFMSKVEGLGGLARKNRFTVEITAPRTLSSAWQDSQINFLAKGISFPARAFGGTTYRSGGRFGLEVPYETTFEPVGLTMLNTNNHAPRKFWTAWFEHIQNVNSTNSKKNYHMQYYKNFIGSVKISNYNEANFTAGESQYEIILHNAWPKSLSAIEVDWESSDLSDFTVDIAYSHWTEKGGQSGGSYTDQRIASFQDTGNTSRGF